jgi:hypothetical protein
MGSIDPVRLIEMARPFVQDDEDHVMLDVIPSGLDPPLEVGEGPQFGDFMEEGPSEERGGSGEDLGGRDEDGNMEIETSYSQGEGTGGHSGGGDVGGGKDIEIASTGDSEGQSTGGGSDGGSGHGDSIESPMPPEKDHGTPDSGEMSEAGAVGPPKKSPKSHREIRVENEESDEGPKRKHKRKSAVSEGGFSTVHHY